MIEYQITFFLFYLCHSIIHQNIIQIITEFQSILICYLIWCRVGWAAVIGVVGLLLKTVPVQTRLSRLSSSLRMKVATRTDGRVGIMNEIIQGIQVGTEKIVKAFKIVL